jgi:2-polyprenyl-3-methyl-5-hydroxy-6-metoxy-1,4-benzoquinol methylase
MLRCLVAILRVRYHGLRLRRALYTGRAFIVDPGNLLAEVADMVEPKYRTGDRESIRGSYQYDAITRGYIVQRFWHFNKKLMIGQFLPPLSSDYILDVGCGSGVISSFLAESGAQVLGVDGNSKAISFAMQQFRQPNLTFEEGLVDSEFKTETLVDKIYCLEVLEHIYLEQGRQMLLNFHRVLRPGGAVFLTTPNYHSLWPIIEWLLDRSKLVAHLVEEQHVEQYHRSRLRSLAESVGLEVEYIVTTCFVAPWLAWLSWRLAEKVSLYESNRVLPGAILVAVFRKRPSLTE